MNFRTPLSKAKKAYINNLGFHTDRKLVVIESDDWGSIRMPSKEIYEELLRSGDPVDKDAFLKNDSLESPEDLVPLFDMLSQYTDSVGRHPCITANFAVANPDFDNICIEEDSYKYEVFLDTYEKYGFDRNRMIQLISNGIDMHFFKPQLHAREHLNVSRWMKALRNNKTDTVLAFKNNMIGVGASFTKSNLFGYMDTLNYDNLDEFELVAKSILDASNIFKSVFGYNSSSFVASCFVWTHRIEKILKSIGVELIQTQFRQNICPFKGTNLMIKPYHYTGQRNNLKQFYSLRNCEYEPACTNDLELSVDSCIKQVEDAFKNKKPAIINSHRLNYIGRIQPDNRMNGIKGLDAILNHITAHHLDVEFVSSDELLNIMKYQ